MNAARLEPVEASRVSKAARDELLALGEGAADRLGKRLRALRIGANRRVPTGLVQRGVGGDHAGNAARHRLDDRDPEALESRRIREDLRTTIESGKLLVGDVAAARVAERKQREVVAPQSQRSFD